MDSRELAIRLVQQNGYLADSEDGRKRVQAILVAAEVCETYAQFTRAAQYALEAGFTSRLGESNAREDAGDVGEVEQSVVSQVDEHPDGGHYG